MSYASSEDCPCCNRCLAPGLDTDRALVVAFLGGVAARDHDTRVSEALCESHARLAKDCIDFAGEHGAVVGADRAGPLKCPRCEGPAVRLAQTGAIVCARQCGETAAAMGHRLAIEEQTAALLRILKSRVSADVGFVLVLADIGPKGNMAYAASIERESAMYLLQELLDKMRVEPRSEAIPPDVATTGMHVRVRRDGAWKTPDIGALSDVELATTFAEMDAPMLRRWAARLASWIRDNVRPRASEAVTIPCVGEAVVTVRREGSS